MHCRNAILRAGLPSDGRIDMPLGGSGGAEQPLELQRGDYVRVASPAKFFRELGVIGLKSGRKNERANLDFFAYATPRRG